jgi:NADH-quinone oxidoreductase subunit L
MNWTIFFLIFPFVSFLIVYLLRRKQEIAPYIAVFSVVFLTIIVFLSNFFVFEEISFRQKWLTINTTHFDIIFSLKQYDFTFYFLQIILFVSSCVFIFSLEYMKKDANKGTYFAYLCFFVGSMIGLVLSKNLLQIYIFWELVGLASYLLIGFWNYKNKANNAAKLAFITNKLADVGFLIGIFGVWFHTNSLEILPTLSTPLPTWVALCLFCGVIGKSAQFPLFFWLPKAMQGPTPVSALLHAATMVAAGIYLLLFLNTSVYFNRETNIVIAYLGMITAFFGAFLGIFAWDIKKILAYSTISQLGYMVLAIGISSHFGAVFHLFTHAFFKAGLFLSAGSIIHYLHHVSHQRDAQDLRNMGTHIRKSLPITFFSFTICAAALIGLPFTAGFFSKEEILKDAFINNFGFIGVVGILTAGITAFYVMRMWLLAFFDNSFKINTIDIKKHSKKESFLIIFPLVALAVMSMIAGYMFSPSLMPHSHHTHASIFFVFSVLSLSWVGMGIGFYVFKYKIKFFEIPPQIENYIAHETQEIIHFSTQLTQKFEKEFIKDIEKLLGYCIVVLAKKIHQIDRYWDKILLRVAQSMVVFAHIFAWIDRHLIDGIVKLFAIIFKKAGLFFTNLQNGQVQSYLTYLLLVIMFMIWVFS